MKKYLIIPLVLALSTPSFSQSKGELKKKVAELEEENKKSKIKWEIEVQKNITKSEQPKTPHIEDGGWRLEINTTQYKNDLSGQLGSLWLMSSDNKLTPQGGISLEKYKFLPKEVKLENDYLYKKFISNKTTLEGEGGVQFVSIKASMKDDQYSNFQITIEGTAQIIPEYDELYKLRQSIVPSFDLTNDKRLYLCTGMHVIKYSAKIYKSVDVSASVSSPVINIGGTYFSESSEEKNDYIVYRQLTPLDQLPTTHTTTQQLTELSGKEIEVIKESVKYFSPQEILVALLKREPTFEELTKFQENSEKFINAHLQYKLNAGQKILLKEASEKLSPLPEKIQIITQPIE